MGEDGPGPDCSGGVSFMRRMLLDGPCGPVFMHKLSGITAKSWAIFALRSMTSSSLERRWSAGVDVSTSYQH